MTRMRLVTKITLQRNKQEKNTCRVPAGFGDLRYKDAKRPNCLTLARGYALLGPLASRETVLTKRSVKSLGARLMEINASHCRHREFFPKS